MFKQGVIVMHISLNIYNVGLEKTKVGFKNQSNKHIFSILHNKELKIGI